MNFLTLSFLLALLAAPYYLKFDPWILDHPLHSMELSLTAKILLVNYTVFFLFLIFSPLVFLLLFLFRKFRKLKTSFSRFSHLQNKSADKFITTVCFVLIAVSASVTTFGFFWENREPAVTYEPLKSNSKQDINVILIVIDALRADHLGCYGYEKETSPHLDALAGRGVLFKNCYTQSTWTKPSVASLLTSLYPSRHGTTLHAQELPGELITIAEIVRDKGYITYGLVMNPNLKKIFNFDQGFDFFDDHLMGDKLYYGVLRQLGQKPPYFLRIFKNRFNTHVRDNALLANTNIIPWLKKYNNQNFFVYIHYMDPHAPFTPPPPYNEMFPYVKGDKDSRTISRYDGEIRFVDVQINTLIGELKSLKIYDKTLIIITSDHGQAFGEHGDYGHGKTIYQDQLKVPLLIKCPGNFYGGRVVEGPVRSIDIVPTILDVLDISSDVPWEGVSVLPLIKNEKTKKSCGNIYIEENLDDTFILGGVIKNNEWKYILTEKSELRDVEKEGREELYNLTQDPEELNNLAHLESDVLETMRDFLVSFKNRSPYPAPNPSRVKVNRETVRQLRALGYLQ
ncbi:MAG: sulfatase [PVC group bacterium]